jgi:pimeloyl-ACP methyl ester carboxylesterase
MSERTHEGHGRLADEPEQDDPADMTSRLRDHLASFLPREAVPTEFVFVDTLPALPNGKVDRAALGRLAAAGTAVEGPAQLPEDDDEATTDDLDFLVRFFTAELSRVHIDLDEDLTRLGAGSLILVKACAAWTERTGRHVDGARLRRNPTIRNILACSSPVARNADNADVVVDTHRFEVPLDHDDPAGPSITVFAQRVVRRENAAHDLPYLLFLPGGPGGQCPDPRNVIPTWLDAALDRYQVVLLDQRGCGRSSPVTADSIAGLTATAALERLRCFRADAIVRDAEFLRERILRIGSWTLLGESYGGSIALTYLSHFPDRIDRAFISSGLIGPVSTADDVLRDTLAMSKKMNAEYHERYPGDGEIIDRIVDHLREHEVLLPTGDRLSPERLRMLGLKFGFDGGMEAVHDLVQNAWDGDDLTEAFVKAVAATDMSSAPLFYLQEYIYGMPGSATRWAADRLYADEPAFGDHARPFHFYGEVAFPWMFRQIGGLRPFAEVADELARYTGWKSLYDLPQLARNTVPVYAVAAMDDLYVPAAQQFRTAQQIGSCWLFFCADYNHAGLMNDRQGLARLLEFGSVPRTRRT